MENKILVDYFSFTSKFDSPEWLIKLLGFDNPDKPVMFISRSGARGYKDALYFEGVNIFYNHSLNNDVWVEMSGKGCRTFDSFSSSDWNYLFSCILAEPDNYHITRLDLAYDDFEKFLNIDKIKKEIIKQNYQSHMRFWECCDSSQGITCYLGSPSSDIRFRIYDKKRERQRDDLEHWIRWEIQMRDERALSCVKSLFEKDEDVGKIFSGILLNYVRFIVPDESQTNSSRLKTQKWYLNFLGACEKIPLWTPCGQEYNLTNCENYVYKMAGNAISALIEIKGLDEFCAELKKEKAPTTQKYQELIRSNKK